jgi:two-component system sensor histidine kinase NblS
MAEPTYLYSSAPRFFTLENRIFILGLLLTTALLALACLPTIRHFTHQVEAASDYQIAVFTETVGALGVVALEYPDERQRVEDILASLIKKQPDVAYIDIQDRNGQTLLRQNTHHPVHASGMVSHRVKLRSGSTRLDPMIGSLVLGVTGDSKKSLIQSVQWTIIMAFLAAWAIASAAVGVITWILSKRLRTFVRGVKRLTSGDFGYRIPADALWGELKHLAESFNDMSTRLRVYEDQNIDTLTFERNKLEAILLSIADGVVVADNDGAVVIINESACEMLDIRNRDLILGTPITAYSSDDGDLCFELVITDFLKSREHNPYDSFVKTVDISGRRTLRVIISAIRDTEGVSLGYVMIMRDITREMEIDRMKTQFISNVSHELRTPVTTIKSYVDTLFNHGDELDAETCREFMATINTETDRLKKMVNDILDFSRLESPEYKMEMDYQDLTPIINLTVQSIKVLVEQKHLTLSTAIESSLPKIYMNSDSIERVLRNLLGNAIKYTPEGGRIKLRAEMVNYGQDLEVTIEDTGVGIPEEHLSRIWDRFYRVENKVHTVKGTGLGLHLVKVAVEEHHHGQVFVKSLPDTGSTFGFRLPLVPGGHLTQPITLEELKTA